MPWWNFWSSRSSSSSNDKLTETINEIKTTARYTTTKLRNEASQTLADLTSQPKPSTTNSTPLQSLTHPSTLISTAVLTTTILTLLALQRRFLRRIPTATDVPTRYILPRTRRFTRSLFGRVTSIGDADNFRIFHTPLGRLALWGILRRVPTDAKQLKNNTVHIRLAGVDAPELSHFGRPAQPYSKEAMAWLTAYLRGRRVRCYVHKADQYGRVVATVYIRKGLLRRDVGLQMLRAGLATVYEAKGGVEFGSDKLEKKYREAEDVAKRKKRGMWKDAGTLETPREYKNKYREGGGG